MPISRDRILYCDDAILAVNKLSGELVVKGSGKVQKLPLLDFLKKEYPGIHPLNRLDFETSGIVLFARTKKVLAQEIGSKFKGWRKIYRTIIAGRIDRDHSQITIPLPARNKGEGNIPATTTYTVLERFANSSYVEAEIESGRHHQIRRHFSLIKFPLVLDDEYGNEKFNRTFCREFGYRRFFLHAWKVTLPHPVTKKEIVIEAPMPRIFEELLAKLKKEY